MKPTAFDRLIAMLPPERRAAAAVSLVGMSDDPDGPIATIYSEIFERLERAEREQRTGHETRDKQLLNQLEKLREASQQTIRDEMDHPHQGKFWHRMLFSRMVAAAACLALVAVTTPIVARHVVRDDLAAQRQAFQSAQAEVATLIQLTLKNHQAEGAKLAEAQRSQIEDLNRLLTANACKEAFHETIGHVINAKNSQIKPTIGPEVITLRIQDNLTRKEQGLRIIEIKHALPPAEFDHLRQTIEAARAVSIQK